jgi:hypothetical protein
VTDTIAEPRARARLRVTTWLDLVAVVVWLAVSLPLMRSLEEPPRAEFVARNDTVWNLTLYVETGPESVKAVATIGAESSKELTEVLVPGDTWRFSWRFTGEEVGRSVVSDADLQRAGFELTVPDEVEEKLRARGTAPAP